MPSGLVAGRASGRPAVGRSPGLSFRFPPEVFMASKVNTKFIVIVVMTLGAAALIIGGLAYFNMRTDAKRSARLAAEAEGAGDLKRALDYWGRAISKEPGNNEYLHGVERMLVQMKPTTR